MNQGRKNRTTLYLFEPRMLLRSVISSALEQQFCNFHSPQTLAYLMESVCSDKANSKIILAGVAGAGPALPDLLRFIRKAKALKIKTVLWVPAGYPWMFRVLSALHAVKVLPEETLTDELIPLLNTFERVNPLLSKNAELYARSRHITLTELEILLQFAAGLSSKEMADSRQCSYKTIFSWKHNICEALNIDSHAQWLEMLTEIGQISSLYQAEKHYGAL
jgi:DNA-binding CsgD family transcriptional regulator